MITFYFENGSVLTMRTSGTEPKIKYYTEMIGSSREECNTKLNILGKSRNLKISWPWLDLELSQNISIMTLPKWTTWQPNFSNQKSMDLSLAQPRLTKVMTFWSVIYDNLWHLASIGLESYPVKTNKSLHRAIPIVQV